MLTFTNESVLLDLIDPPSDPLRETMDETELGALADSMAANGLRQPVGLAGPSPSGRYEIVWGHRRLMAATMIGWHRLDARVCPWSTPRLLARAEENVIRADLTMREEAMLCRRFVADGATIEATSRHMRKSTSWVRGRLAFLSWPEDVQHAVSQGILTAQAGELLLEIDHAEYRASLIAEAQRVGANARTVAVWVAHYGANRDSLLRNHATIEHMLAQKETYRIVFKCDACQDDTDAEQTTSLRLCPSCMAALAEYQRELAVVRKAEAEGNGHAAPG